MSLIFDKSNNGKTLQEGNSPATLDNLLRYLLLRIENPQNSPTKECQETVDYTVPLFVTRNNITSHYQNEDLPTINTPISRQLDMFTTSH
ncbi:hypothetical protein EUGRSUZ_K02645 [Eucalyptus grandis]|uniref:Uncharacterized protein n=2 Tax=Eucalyptus grandis TaxID=71139 RepID=A0ACC3IXI0_EUCGR|nr:hypothetical protein EUGRSUZ_K02645 [Eucalyptus grandis]